MAVGEEFHVQTFVAQFVVEALDVGVLPGASCFDVEGLSAAFL